MQGWEWMWMCVCDAATSQAAEVAHWLKARVAKPEDLRSI